MHFPMGGVGVLGLRFRLLTPDVESPVHIWILSPRGRGRERGRNGSHSRYIQYRARVSKVLLFSSKVSCSWFAFVVYMGNRPLNVLIREE